MLADVEAVDQDPQHLPSFSFRLSFFEMRCNFALMRRGHLVIPRCVLLFPFRFGLELLFSISGADSCDCVGRLLPCFRFGRSHLSLPRLLNGRVHVRPVVYEPLNWRLLAYCREVLLPDSLLKLHPHEVIFDLRMKDGHL